MIVLRSIGFLLFLGCVYCVQQIALEISEYTARFHECRDLEVCVITLGGLE